jgi:hypothetical protein
MAPRPVGDATGSEPSQLPFIDALPLQLARDCLTVWRDARQGDTLPALRNFAPHLLPPTLLPWLLIHRQRVDGAFVYGLAGDELIRWFGENPRGKPVLGNIDAAEREQRLALVRQSLATAMPFWFRGTLLLENHDHVQIGRLCLPARDNAEHVLLLVYFVLGEAPRQRLRVIGDSGFEVTQVTWCRASDLVA